MGVAMAAGSGLLKDMSCPGIVVAGTTGKVHDRGRSFLSQAKRNTTFVCLPDRRVDGAAPARQVSDSASGTGPPGTARSTRDEPVQLSGFWAENSSALFASRCYLLPVAAI